MTPRSSNFRRSLCRRLAGWLLIAALAALAVYIILRMPYDGQRLHQCIPDSAAVVSVHHNLAARYEYLATNVLLRPILQAAGLDPAKLNPADAERLRRCAPYIAGRTTLLGWMPRMRLNGRPGLAIVSWMGRAGLGARWWLELRAPGRLQRQPAYAGYSIWTVAHPANPAGWRLVFTIHEGMLLALFSPDPDGIREIIQTAERLLPSAGALANRDFLALPPEAADRCWLRRPISMAAAVTAITPQTCRVRLNASDWLPAPAGQLPAGDLQPMADLLGDSPVMAAMLNADAARHLAALLPGPFDCSDLLLPRQDGGGASLGLALLTGKDGGGFGTAPWRLSIPALAGYLPLGSPDDGPAVVKRALDRLNARYRLGLIADGGEKLTGHSLVEIFTIEPTTENFLARLAAEDRPAYAVLDHGLFFCSNAGALARRFAAASRNATANPRWRRALAGTPCSAMLWMNMPGGIAAVQLGMTALALQMRAAGRPDQPFWLKTIRQWLDELRNMQTARIWLDPDQPTVFVEISGNKDAD